MRGQLASLFLILLAVLPSRALAQEAAAQLPLAKLPSLALDATSVTTSGISAGAFMATQLHISFSSVIKGSASIAGGPWNCAQDSVINARYECMNNTDLINVDRLLKQLRAAEARGVIDPLANLRNDRMYLLNSDRDDVVKPPMRRKTLEFFSQLIPQSSIVVETKLKSAHGFPTKDFGLPCDVQGSPYMLDCDYDTAGEIFKALYPSSPVLSRARSNPHSLFRFDQNELTPPSALLASEGYVYIPAACRNNQSKCRLHIALHGCLMAKEHIAESFVTRAGYNEWAEASGIVVLYPQAERSVGNPNACFDWFGYSSFDYANQKGPQMRAIRAMIDRLTSH